MHKRICFMKKYSYPTLTKNYTIKIKQIITYKSLFFEACFDFQQIPNSKYYINHIAKTYLLMRKLTALSFWRH